jgi:hypothetical protein
LILSIFWHVLAFTMGIVRAGLFLWFVFGVDDWAKASAMWFFGSRFDCIIFMVPAALGTQEHTRALIFERAIGLGTYALEMALSRRWPGSERIKMESDAAL